MAVTVGDVALGYNDGAATAPEAGGRAIERRDKAMEALRARS